MNERKEIENSILLLESMSQRLADSIGGMERNALMVAVRHLREKKAIMDDLAEPQ